LTVSVEEVTPSQEVVVEDPPTDPPTEAPEDTTTEAPEDTTTGAPEDTTSTTGASPGSGNGSTTAKLPSKEKISASSADSQTILFAATISLLMASLWH